MRPLTALMWNSSGGVLTTYVAEQLTAMLSQVARRPLPAAVGPSVLVAVAPLWYALELVRGAPVQLYMLAVLGSYTLVCWLSFEWPRKIWTAWTALAPDVEKTIAEHSDSARLAEWMGGKLRRGPQWILAALGGALSVAVAWRVDAALAGQVELRTSYYVLIALTGALGVNVIYWLIMAPWLLLRACRLDRLTVRWNDPVNTPALRSSAQVVLRAAWMASAGLALFLLPILWTRLLAPEDSVLGVIVDGGMLVSFGTVAYVGVLPQYALQSMADRHWRRSLDLIAAELPSSPVYDLHGPLNEEVLQLEERYDRLLHAHTRFLDRGTVAQLAAMLIGALAPFALALLFAW